GGGGGGPRRARAGGRGEARSRRGARLEAGPGVGVSGGRRSGCRELILPPVRGGGRSMGKSIRGSGRDPLRRTPRRPLRRAVPEIQGSWVVSQSAAHWHLTCLGGVRGDLAAMTNKPITIDTKGTDHVHESHARRERDPGHQPEEPDRRGDDARDARRVDAGLRRRAGRDQEQAARREEDREQEGGGQEGRLADCAADDVYIVSSLL